MVMRDQVSLKAIRGIGAGYPPDLPVEDEVVQVPPIDWEQGVRFVDVNYRIARAIADGDQRPAWNQGDYFGVLYHGFGAGDVVAVP